MKTTAKYVIASLLMGALCISCSKLPEINENEAVGETLYDYTITASQETSPSKAELGKDNVITWQAGDAISLLNDETTPREFKLVGEAGTSSGTFSGKLPSERASLEDFIAIYPDNAYHSISYGGGKVTAQWKNNGICAEIQPATPEGFWPGSALMAGKIDAEGNVSFKNLMAYIKFEVKFPCTSIEISSNNGEYLASDAVDFYFDENGIPTDIQAAHEFGVPTKGYDSILLEGIDGEDVAAGTYLVAVLPQTLEQGVTLTFTSAASGLSFEKKITKGFTLTRSKILNIGSYSISSLIGDHFDGLGTAENPYRIPDLESLKLLANIFSDSSTAQNYYGKHFLQTDNIDCNGATLGIGYTRMAHSGDMLYRYESPFWATYDGGNHTISNYKIKSIINGPNGARYAGLFLYTFNATIKNLTVKPYADDNGVIYTAKQKGLTGMIQHIGCLVGVASGNRMEAKGKTIIQNCHLAGGPYKVQGFTKDDVAGSNYIQQLHFGGLVGLSEDSIELTRCTNKADLTLAGGIMTSDMDGLYSTAGGLVGMMYPDEYKSDQAYADISFCRNDGDVTLDPVRVGVAACGGLIGYIVDSRGANVTLHMWNCVNGGNVKSATDAITAYTGGLIGFHDSDGDTSHDPWIYNCLNRGSILAYGSETSTGGLVGAGYDDNLKIFYCANANLDNLSMGADAEVGAITGKETSFWDNQAAYCVECFWADIDGKDDGKGTPHVYVMPGQYEWGNSYGSGDFIDCYFYKPGNLTPDKILPKMRAGTFTANSEWKTTEAWLAKAANWIVTDSMLDLDFTESVGGNSL